MTVLLLTLQIYPKCRKLTINGGTAQGPGIVPTATDEFIFTGGVVNGDQEIEYDKMVNTFTSTGTTWDQWKVQAVGDWFLDFSRRYSNRRCYRFS